MRKLSITVTSTQPSSAKARYFTARLDGEQSGWWAEVGTEHVPKFSERKGTGFQVVWRTRLNPGQWRVVLRINGRVVAQREVEILELFL